MPEWPLRRRGLRIARFRLDAESSFAPPLLLSVRDPLTLGSRPGAAFGRVRDRGLRIARFRLDAERYGSSPHATRFAGLAWGPLESKVPKGTGLDDSGR